MTFWSNTDYKNLGYELHTGQGLNSSFGSGITSSDDAANASGTTRATGYQINAVITYFTTVAANGIALLPKAIPGSKIYIFNEGANTLTFNGFTSSDTIDGAASQTLSTANRGATLFCYSPGKWVTALLGAVTS